MSYSGRETEGMSTLGHVWFTVMESILLRLVVVGVLLILIGALLNTGLWAAILPLWGGALIILGLSFYALIWWSHQ